MLKYLTHKLKTQSINEENPNEKVSDMLIKLQEIFSGRNDIFHSRAFSIGRDMFRCTPNECKE